MLWPPSSPCLVLHPTFFLLIFQLVFASPIASNSGSSIVINQIPNPNVYTGPASHPGVSSMAKALRKHGTAKSASRYMAKVAIRYGGLRATTRKGQVGGQPGRNGISEPITAAPTPFDRAYISPVTIGSQDFLLDFDTGSSDLWVFGPSAIGLLPNQTSYKPGPTATRLLNESFHEFYGDSSVVAGIVFSDIVNLGGISVAGQAIEVATSFDGDFAAEDGILGLGFDAGNQVRPRRQKTLLTNLMNNNLLSQPVFSVDLRHQQPGCYTFGTIRTDSYSGSLTYTPVFSSTNLWSFQPLGFGVGPSGPLNTSTETQLGLRGVADTGTTLMILEPDIARAYWEQVPNARIEGDVNGWVFDCDVGSLPDFRVLIGDFDASGNVGDTFVATVPGEYMNYSTNGDGTCYGGLQYNEDFSSIPFSIWGDVFLKSVFAVFDRGSNGNPPRLGFANKA